jgi:hypothetical protein
MIEMDIWRAQYSSQAREDVGVRVYATGAGAVLFSNADQRISAVIPTAAFEKVMLHHAVDDRFARDSGSQTADDPLYRSGSQPAAYLANWLTIWSPTLANEGLPPTDKVRRTARGEERTIHYQYLPTMEEHPIPEMGLEPRANILDRIYDSEVASPIRIESVILDREEDILILMEGAENHNRVRVECLADRHS